MSQVFPAHWDVLPFSLAVKDATSEYSKLQKSEYLEQGRFPIVDQGQNKFGGYTNDESVVSLEGYPAIVFGDHTRIFKFIDEPFCLGADGAKVLEPKVELDRKFLFYYLSSLNIESAGYSRHFKFLKENVVPVPPLPEQKRIAAILDKADAIRRKRQQAIQLADDFLRAVFLDMFGDPVTNPKGWDVKRIEEVAAKDKYAIKAGPFGSALKKEDYVPEGYKIYGQEQVIRDDLEYGDYFINEEKYESLASCSVSEGDVLISLVGSFGKVSVVPKDYNPGIINPRLMKIRFNESCASPWYMKYLLTTKEMIKKIEGMSHGGTMGILNVGKIRDLEVINPPLNLQESFLKISTQVRSIKARCELVAAHPLFDSLSQKAFSGQL